MKILEFITPRTVKCVCDCGVQKECYFYDLKRGRIISCGCQRNNPQMKKEAAKRIIEIASVDRIDSQKNYSLDNIQYVSRSLNYAKSTMSHQQMLQFISSLKKVIKTMEVDGFEPSS